MNSQVRCRKGKVLLDSHLRPEGAAELGIRGTQDEVVAGPTIQADLEGITCAHGGRGGSGGGGGEGSLEPLRKTQPNNGPYIVPYGVRVCTLGTGMALNGKDCALGTTLTQVWLLLGSPVDRCHAQQAPQCARGLLPALGLAAEQRPGRRRHPAPVRIGPRGELGRQAHGQAGGQCAGVGVVFV